MKRFGNEKIYVVKSIVELHGLACEELALSSEEIVEDLEFIRKKVWESENVEHWRRLSLPFLQRQFNGRRTPIQENT